MLEVIPTYILSFKLNNSDTLTILRVPEDKLISTLQAIIFNRPQFLSMELETTS